MSMIICERIFQDSHPNGRLFHLNKNKEGMRVKQLDIFGVDLVVEKRGDKYFVLKDRYGKPGRMITYEELVLEGL